ncbi:integrin-linked protein kinase 1-like isoform X1 [Salvia splendens]|uniref:integrin-linked protein kinase 1-like isoform X1 n=1 Tax=Salvia splendens TaxID=180675 RepID=UPI001C259761|nr:integrin-linked protein kinase 1-like isoform X1 [Salvia splendens]XP_041995222.1 integrin-linked protein kinase 1-like isoform X1 [Salvia splendens]XP_041995223.1 integrin-linked protein kinase 1-like isoform X1 [Salvia splendens]
MAPGEKNNDGDDVSDIDPGLKLMYLTNERDLDGIKELLDSGADVNFRDIDNRTALHIAACQGFSDVAKLLLENGAHVDLKDRWSGTPLADAIHYKNHDVIKLLEEHGAKQVLAPMQVENPGQLPDYEIDPKEIDLTNSIEITKGTFKLATWAGTKVAVKVFYEGAADENKVRSFRDELSLLLSIRHPNVVQFIGAVTQSSPMMIVTEYLPKGDLHEYLKRKGSLKPAKAIRLAMDIARGMNYLHERRPGAIIHRNLEPSNILRDDSGHLKVADFGISKLLKVAKSVKEERPLPCQDSTLLTGRYLAPEVFRNQDYDTKVDVFSFALILQELIEGCPPFSTKQEHEVPKSCVAKERPPFKAPMKLYANGLKELIEECWSENPADRPTFRQIIPRLEGIHSRFNRGSCWKVIPLDCFQHWSWTKCHSGSSSRSDSSRSLGSNV